MTPSLHVDQLQNFAQQRGSLSKGDLYAFYESLEQCMSHTTLNWRIHMLLQKGYITRLGSGVYHWGKAKAFEPDINKTEININRVLSSALPFAKKCIWNTSILNKWMLHQPSEFYTIAEIEKDALESAFHILREQYTNIFIQPDKEILNRYVLDKANTVIVIPLISEAPVQQVMLKGKNSIFTVTIEKLIVDLFCEKEIFFAQQGSELPFIINNILSLYSINFNKMFRYASRRSKKEPLLELLNSKTKFPDFGF